MRGIALPSGLQIRDPKGLLVRFCQQEYEYYDAAPVGHPDRIEPLDVLATVSVNSGINRAALVRSVHRGMAALCDPLLPAIPPDADLLIFDPTLEQLRELLHAAIQTPNVLASRATKVLHRKRPSLIPMLDWYVHAYYGDPPSQNKRYAAEAAVRALHGFRDDLRQMTGPLDELLATLDVEGYRLTRVRVLELLVWTMREPAGYYR